MFLQENCDLRIQRNNFGVGRVNKMPRQYQQRQRKKRAKQVESVLA